MGVFTESGLLFFFLEVGQAEDYLAWHQENENIHLDQAISVIEKNVTEERSYEYDEFINPLPQNTWIVSSGPTPYMNNSFGKSVNNSLGLLNPSSLSFTTQKCYECNRCRKLLIPGKHETNDRMKFHDHNMYGKDQIYNFVQHDLTQLGTRSYECPECRIIPSPCSFFIVHQISNLGEKPYEWEGCREAFNNTAHLRLHQKIHAVDQLFECNECGNPSERNQHCIYIKEHIQVKNHLYAMSVVVHSKKRQISLYIGELTKEKNPINVQIVRKPSTKRHI